MNFSRETWTQALDLAAELLRIYDSRVYRVEVISPRFEGDFYRVNVVPR